MKIEKLGDKEKLFKCCYGISSKAGVKDEHVFMTDYDGFGIESVVNQLKQIQKEFNMSDIYIIESEHGFNAICLDVMNLSLIYNIGIDVFSFADRDFFRYGFNRGYFTLRFDKDKKIVRILKNESHKYIKSLAHKLFLEWYFDIFIDSDYSFNNYTNIKLVQYPSNKNGYHLFEKQLPQYLEVMKDD